LFPEGKKLIGAKN